jgi:hypothetical protein
MAGKSSFYDLAAEFAEKVSEIATRQAHEAFAAKFESVRSQILGGSISAPLLPAKRKAGRPKGSRASYAAQVKPCPVCGKENKARRYSYLCDEHRTEENLAKFKGGAKALPAAPAPAAKRGPGRPPKVAKRGPGRPPKAAADASPKAE